MKNKLAVDCLPERALVVAPPDHSVFEAAHLMGEHCCGSVAVMDGDRLLGIFTESDLAGRVVGKGLDVNSTAIESVMTRDPALVEASDSVLDAIRKMHECGFQHLPVMREGKVIGMLSWRDLPLDVLAQIQPELDERDLLTERML